MAIEPHGDLCRSAGVVESEYQRVGALTRHAIAELAVRWHAAEDEHSATIAITSETLAAVDGIDAVGIVRRVGDGLASRAPTGDAAVILDALQAQSPQGPSRQVLHTQRPLVLTALATDTRWPTFTARAAQVGVASMLCLPLRAGQQDLGTLNVYSRAAGSFPDDDDVEAVVDLATHAALALHAVAERDQLLCAVDSRDRIGQAKGILMLRHHCTAQQAFDRLVAASQAANVKLVDVAEWLLERRGGPGGR